MKKIVLFNTSMGSVNMGDYIINEAISEELRPLFDGNFVVSAPTHTPIMHSYQRFFNSGIAMFSKNSDYKFICGTNILKKNMLKLFSDWNVNIFNYTPYAGSVLIGCGKAGDYVNTNFYTKHLYKKILSDKYIHSVRDNATKQFLTEQLGLKAINTGCPTLWMLNKDFCKLIPRKKSENVVFTLTDYCKDRKRDQELLDILQKNYKRIYFWLQGSDDLDYLKSLEKSKNIILVSPSLEAYKEVLDRGNIDYIGTRLHAGIYAMRHRVRSIILEVDNRTRDMKATYNLVTLKREDIMSLDDMINNSFDTRINIDEKSIEKWKGQFGL